MRMRRQCVAIVPCYGLPARSMGPPVTHSTAPASTRHRPSGQEALVVNHVDSPPTEGQPEQHAMPSPVEAVPEVVPGEREVVSRPDLRGVVSVTEVSRGARNVARGWPEPAQDIDGALGELPGLLARASSGLEFIYEMLELVCARYLLRDLLVVVERNDRPQIFRVGRRPLVLERSFLPPYLADAFAGRPGLYAEPPVVGPLVAASVTSLADLALRLDLLDHDASHDALTGLLNRRSYELLLAQAVSRARRYGWPFALVLLDLDNFKVVNDRYGHAAGDDALRAVGAELRASLRSGDVAARVGGDEFALLVVGVENVASLSPLLGRLKTALDRAVPETNVGFSVGVACFPSDTDDPQALTGLADARLYAAKATMA
jgi:diguanylate cyclase (GGDEF)-like protein